MWAQTQFKTAEEDLQSAMGLFDKAPKGDDKCSEKVTFDVGNKRFEFKQDEKKVVKTTVSKI